MTLDCSSQTHFPCLVDGQGFGDQAVEPTHDFGGRLGAVHTRVASLCIYISTVERCPAFTTPISAYVNISSKFVYHQTGERPSHNRQVLNPCQPGRKGVDVHVKATEENCWEYEVIWSR